MRLHSDERSLIVLTVLRVVVYTKTKLGEAGAFKGFQGATSSSRLSRYYVNRHDEQSDIPCHADCMYDRLQPLRSRRAFAARSPLKPTFRRYASLLHAGSFTAVSTVKWSPQIE